MKAKELVKKEVHIKGIYDEIERQNEAGCFKHFIPHFIHISDETKLKLIQDGFKVYTGDWDNVSTNCLIIEW